MRLAWGWKVTKWRIANQFFMAGETPIPQLTGYLVEQASCLLRENGERYQIEEIEQAGSAIALDRF